MKTLRGALALAVTLAFAACGGGNKQADTTTTTTAAAQADVAVELGEFTLFDGDNAVAKIHADGSTELGGTSESGPTWKPGPTIKQDGTVEFEGAAVAKINADGTIVDVRSNQKLPVTVTSDRITVQGEKQITLDLAANGSITITGEQSDKPARIEGANTPGQRRTALSFLAILLGAQAGPPQTEQSVTPEPGAGSATPPAPGAK